MGSAVSGGDLFIFFVIGIALMLFANWGLKKSERNGCLAIIFGVGLVLVFMVVVYIFVK